MNLKTKYKEVENKEQGGIELYFESIPNYNERQILKQNGYHWNNIKKCWYIKKEKINKNKNENTNYLNIKIGDIFYMIWGYEQTYVDFFQVVGLKGKTQVKLKEVSLIVENEERITDMRCDRIYNKEKVTIVKNGCFIEDNEKGKLKKVLGTKENPYINMTSYANAYLYNGEKIYESWYY